MFSMPDSSQGVRGEVQFAVPPSAERDICLGFLVCWLVVSDTPHPPW